MSDDLTLPLKWDASMVPIEEALSDVIHYVDRAGGSVASGRMSLRALSALVQVAGGREVSRVNEGGVEIRILSKRIEPLDFGCRYWTPAGWITLEPIRNAGESRHGTFYDAAGKIVAEVDFLA